MSILSQVNKSGLSKKGMTNPSGVWEGTPANVGNVTRSQARPQATSVLQPIQNPVDVTYNSAPQPTYLTYLYSVNKK